MTGAGKTGSNYCPVLERGPIASFSRGASRELPYGRRLPVTCIGRRLASLPTRARSCQVPGLRWRIVPLAAVARLGSALPNGHPVSQGYPLTTGRTKQLLEAPGGMREWPNRAVSKTAVGVCPPWVQIPLPPLTPCYSFGSRQG